MIPAQAPNEGGEPTMRKGSYSEELVWMSIAMLAHLSRKPAILLKSSVIQLRVVIVGASMRTPPGESARRRQGPCCDSKRWTQLHTPSPPWTPSVRVDVEPRALRHWRVCAPWQSRSLQPHKTESSVVSNKRRWRVRQLAWWRSGAVQVIIPALGSRSDLCVVVVTTSQCSKGEGCCFVATRPKM